MSGIVSAAAQTKAKQNTIEQNLKALVRQAIEAQANFDSAALEKIYASDYVEISPVGEVDPPEKAIGFYKPQANKGESERKTIADADEISVCSYKNFAVIIARITFSQAGIDSASGLLVSFRATYVCRKEKGEWKITSVQVTVIRPPRPQQTK
jgi:ketosteroid isomerase-like protein